MKALVLSLALSLAYVISLCSITAASGIRKDLQLSTQSDYSIAHKEVQMSLHPKHFESAAEAPATGSEGSPQAQMAQQKQQSSAEDLHHSLQYSSDLITYRGLQIAHLYIDSRSDSPIELEVYDMSGKRIYQQQAHLQNGLNRYEFNLQYVQDGIYYVVARNEEQQSIQKIVKQTMIIG